MSTNGTVLLEPHGEVAVLRLARPEVHNVVDDTVMRRLEALLDELDASPARVLVLAGTGTKTFCAGGDLAYFTTLDSPGDGEAMSRRAQAILRRLVDGPRPVIAALNGNVIGGGCELALACHLRIAARGIRFSFRPAALGLITGWGGGLRLFRQVGRSTALRLLLLAESVDTDEALRLGLVDRVVEPEEVMDEALAWAQRIASNSAASVRAILELDRSVRRDSEDEIVATETRLFAELWEGKDFRRALGEWSARKSRVQRSKRNR